MKQSGWIKILSVAVLIIAVACGQGPNKPGDAQNEIPADWKILEQSTYAIRYPDSFTLAPPGTMGASFILLTEQTSADDKFRENINLMIEDLKGKSISLDRYAKVAEAQIKTHIADGDIIESKRVKRGNSEFHTIIYTATWPHVRIKQEQRYMMKKDKVYVLTFSAELEQFENYKDVGRKIMDSFQVK